MKEQTYTTRLGRRALALVLSLVLCLGMLPVGAWAALNESTDTSKVQPTSNLVESATFSSTTPNKWSVDNETGIKSATITKDGGTYDLTLTLSLTAAAKISWTETYSGQNVTGEVSVNGGSAESFKATSSETVKYREYELDKDDNTITWTLSATAKNNRTLTLSDFKVIDPNSLRTVTVEAAGTDDTVDLTGAAATANNAASATVVGGETVTLKATDGNAASFDGWYIGGEKISEERTYTYNVTENVTVTAKFTSKAQYTLTVAIDGAGTVKVGDTSVENGGTVDVYGGNTYALTATPTDAVFTQFDGWYDGETKLNGNSYTPTGNKTLTAKFVPVTISGFTPPNGMTVGVAAGTWTYKNGMLSSTLNSNKTTTLKMRLAPSSDSVLVFDYAASIKNVKKDTYKFQITLNDGSPNVQTAIANATESGTAEWSLTGRKTYELTATWTRNDSGNTNTVSIGNFELFSGDSLTTLKVKTEGNEDFGAADAVVTNNGKGWLTTSLTENETTAILGSNVVLSAAPANNAWSFVQWKLNGTAQGSDPELTYAAKESDKNDEGKIVLTAVFEKRTPAALTVTAGAGGTAEVLGGAAGENDTTIYYAGGTYTLRATPNTGKKFTGWYRGATSFPRAATSWKRALPICCPRASQ